MPAKRLSMRKIQEILRLKYGHGLSNRDISNSTTTSRSTVADYLLRTSAAGISWPLPKGMKRNWNICSCPDGKPLPEHDACSRPITHDNIRGSQYYHHCIQ